MKSVIFVALALLAVVAFISAAPSDLEETASSEMSKMEG